MIVTDERNNFKDLISEATHILVAVPQELGEDALGASCALAEVIETEGKNALIIYQGAQETKEKFQNFADISQDLPQTELTVSLDYKDTPIEKVSYTTENGIFKMKIFPVQKDFDTSKISYEFSGAKFDLIVTIGAKSPESFGDFYKQNTDIFKRATIINFDNAEDNLNFANINIVETRATSLSSLVLAKMISWGYFPSQKTSEALLLGMRQVKPLTETA